MFQYSFFLYLKKKYKQKVFCDLSYFDFKESESFTHRLFSLESAFKLQIKDFRKTIILKICRPLKINIIQNNKIIDDNNFDSSVFYNNVTFDGYWQNSKYVDYVLDEITSLFKFNQSTTLDSAGSYINPDHTTVGIHVRRGDYVSNRVISSIHNVCNKEYFYEALDLIKKRTGDDIKVFVFSDDINWCMKELNFSNTVVYLSQLFELKDWEEMALLSQCNHQIISNSTFSWWAAKLNRKENSYKIAPSKWFHNDEINTLNVKNLLNDFEIIE